jgi:hypothetical protein
MNGDHEETGRERMVSKHHQVGRRKARQLAASSHDLERGCCFQGI